MGQRLEEGTKSLASLEEVLLALELGDGTSVFGVYHDVRRSRGAVFTKAKR